MNRKGDSFGTRCNAADGQPASFCLGTPCKGNGCTGPASSPLACKAACDSSSECTGFVHNQETPWKDGSWCIMYHEAGGTPGFSGVTYNGNQKAGNCHYHVANRNGGNAIDVPSSATAAATYQSYACYTKDETAASGARWSLHLSVRTSKLHPSSTASCMSHTHTAPQSRPLAQKHVAFCVRVFLFLGYHYEAQ
eukprot:SAG31_NODE_2183_length_6238_cov_4.637917_3_plen_194_part_00